MTFAILLLAATVARPWLGAGLVLQSDTSGGRFLYVAAVPEGTPMAKAGVRERDLITAIDGKPIPFRDDLDLLEFLAGCKPDQIVKMRIVREGKTLDVRVRIGRMPPEYEERWNASLARAREARAAEAKQ